jgi:aromatic ring-opening dioxygenase LigB subunit
VTVVIISPHGRAATVYETMTGSLDGFGIPNRTTESRRADDLAAHHLRTQPPFLRRNTVAMQPLPDMESPGDQDRPDHGITVPLLVVSDVLSETRLVAAALPECTGPQAVTDVATVLAAARQLAAALVALASDRDIYVIASAHTSAALSPQAPLLERPEGIDLDQRIAQAVTNDPAELTRIEPETWERGGSCGAGSLSVFGALSDGRSPTVWSHEASFGVGYLTASWVTERAGA